MILQTTNLANDKLDVQGQRLIREIITEQEKVGFN